MALARRLMVLCALAVLLPVAAGAQSDAARVGEGCTLYSQARFDEAIAVLERVLLQGTLTADERLEARICLARSYVKAGDETGAREVFKSILRLDPDWVPDEFEVPPDEIAVFEQARDEMGATGGPAPDVPEEGPPAEVTPTPTPIPTPTPQEPAQVSQDDGGKPWWLWPLVGVVAVGGAIAALAGGGGDDGGGNGGDANLPDFPDPPTKLDPQPQ